MSTTHVAGVLVVCLCAIFLIILLYPRSHARVQSRLGFMSTSKPRIGIVSMWCGNSSNPYPKHETSRRCYAKKHGYGYHIEDACKWALKDGLDFTYGKVIAMQKYLRQYEALVWMDADVVVGKYSVSMEEFLGRYPQSSLIVPSYYPDLGQPFGNWFFIMRNTHWSYEFLAAWLALGYKHKKCYWEQATMLVLIVRSLVEHLTPSYDAQRQLIFNSSCSLEAPTDCKQHLGVRLWWCFRQDLAALGVDKMFADINAGKEVDLPVAQLPFTFRRGLKNVVITAGYIEPHGPQTAAEAFLAHIKSNGPHAEAFFRDAYWPPPCT